MLWMRDGDTETRAESDCEVHLRRKDLFLRLPTGFGKKLCYNVLPFVFVVKLGRLTNNSTNRLGTSKLNGTLQCRSIAIVNIPRGRRHCTHPLIVRMSLKSTWTSCTNYAHARTVDTRRTFPLFNAPGYEAKMSQDSQDIRGPCSLCGDKGTTTPKPGLQKNRHSS